MGRRWTSFFPIHHAAISNCIVSHILLNWPARDMSFRFLSPLAWKTGTGLLGNGDLSYHFASNCHLHRLCNKPAVVICSASYYTHLLCTSFSLQIVEMVGIPEISQRWKFPRVCCSFLRPMCVCVCVPLFDPCAVILICACLYKPSACLWTNYHYLKWTVGIREPLLY